MAPPKAAVTQNKSAPRTKPSAPRLVFLRLDLTPTAKGQLAGVAAHFGMSQYAILSRLVEWYTVQPEAVQASILGGWKDKAGPDVARMILEPMAGQAGARKA